jgi:hypothetical protein
MENIEIVLKKDSQGNDIELDNMSLDASKSLREILDALISIVEHEKHLNLHLGLEKGSAAQKIIGDEPNLKIVYNKILDAANCKPERDNFYVNQLNVIYKSIKNIREYDIYYNSYSSKESIKPLFKKKFKNTKLRDLDSEYKVEFISGILELNGGKKPNFHLKDNDISYTIQCSFDEAVKVNPFLYKEIKVSAWVKKKKEKLEYTFCDLYSGESEIYFEEFKSFFLQLSEKKGTESFHFISEKLEHFYDSKNYSGAKKFIRLFLTKHSLPIYLRTILVISKAFKNDDYFIEYLKKVEELLVAKIGKVY